MKVLDTPIFVALDVDSAEEARRIAQQTKNHVGGYKIGPRLCMRYGAGLIAELAAHRPVFVDNKYFDIPNTMESAIRATYEAGASFATVHAQSGSEALKRLAAIEAELCAQCPFKILSVTILTSFAQGGLPSVSAAQPIAEQVKALADLTIESGLSGIVSSAAEVASLRQAHPSSFLVIPGIRLPGNDVGDQKRVLGPREALALGASALVVGRPIVDAKDPAGAAEQFHKAIAEFK